MSPLKAAAGLLVAMLVAANPAAAQKADIGERELREACGFHPDGINVCLSAKVHESETRLRAAHDYAYKQIALWDEYPKYKQLARTRLRTADMAYAKYREAHCAFAASIGGGVLGYALETRRLACVAALNDRRAESLQSFTVGLEKR